MTTLDKAKLKQIVEQELQDTIEDTIEEKVNDAVEPLKQQATNNAAMLGLSGPTTTKGNAMSDFMVSTEPKTATKCSTNNSNLIGGVLRAVAAGAGDGADTIKFAEKAYGKEAPVTKALAAGDFSAGGAILEGDVADEVIPLLRPFSAVRRMEPEIQRIPFGEKTFPKITTGASSGYVGENEDISVTEPETGTVQMSAKKLAALVPVSNDLLRYDNGSINAENMIRNELAKEVGTTEDVNFIRGDGNNSAPLGLRHWASNTFDSNGNSNDNVRTDLETALENLEGNNVVLQRPFWIMPSRTRNNLLFRTDSNGNFAFPEVKEGQLAGHPLLVSNNIPTNLGSGDETEIYLVEASEVMVGEVQGILLEADQAATYKTSGGTVISAWQRDQTLIRVIFQHDIALKHNSAVSVITGVTYKDG